MAERKVLNKYIPPDFDPAKIPRLRLGKSRQIKVRLTAPFSMRCETCGQWIGKGTKFNARKEAVEGEKFHSMQIFRFYIRCQRCAAEITYKTDYENLNYEVEKGAQRNFEPWREEKAINEELQREKEEEEENNPIKALENRTEQSRREMEELDELDELRMLNAKSERVLEEDVVDAIAHRGKSKEEEIQLAEDEEDERLARMAFSRVNGKRIKRAREEDAEEREREIKQSALVPAHGSSVSKKTANASKREGANALSRALQGIIAVKPKENSQPSKQDLSSSNNEAPATLAGMLGAYGSDDDDN
ncbi:Pre-mRNA-splicing factor cwf16 [Coemansia sp. RSA 1813]|nr:Pre-mRNA-splicing factor cwf16 [Coemansia sp. RSA 1646]KAJ1771751.1 Pre-mRNA-splicing factor cwf16 [Coemansia sp. RSA 1843]KAJ2091684.1 Pre-mRNA-splicing factor cwf16 [Coemansia sp. RSA 986]KAJ2216914.1 Pre-mRNA-splicing factor cwf16 [Coemansia sp. RSA 487]KAJ2571917.1 Pre-mRNA-splicing factor cwf16 [Coemansia sp. RSA 1813]